MTTNCSLNYKFRTCCVHKLFLHSEQFMYLTCSELVVFMYWTGKSMNNLWSYCGLVDVRINASDKDLPVPLWFHKILGGPLMCKNLNTDFKKALATLCTYTMCHLIVLLISHAIILSPGGGSNHFIVIFLANDECLLCSGMIIFSNNILAKQRKPP